MRPSISSWSPYRSGRRLRGRVDGARGASQGGRCCRRYVPLTGRPLWRRATRCRVPIWRRSKRCSGRGLFRDYKQAFAPRSLRRHGREQPAGGSSNGTPRPTKSPRCCSARPARPGPVGAASDPRPSAGCGRRRQRYLGGGAAGRDRPATRGEGPRPGCPPRLPVAR